MRALFLIAMLALPKYTEGGCGGGVKERPSQRCACAALEKFEACVADGGLIEENRPDCTMSKGFCCF